MQERYLGDIHDFFKFNYLEYLAKKLDSRVGLNWYLVSPNDLGKNELLKNDGEKRDFINNKDFVGMNPQLANNLLQFIDPKKRNISYFTKTFYLKKFIKFYNKIIKIEARENWFKESLIFFQNIDIIFLDPDNGITFTNKGKLSLKYLNLNELDNYFNSGKIVIFTQFQSFNTCNQEYINSIVRNLKNFNLKINYPIIRNRTGPNTFYISLSKNTNFEYIKVIENYSKKFKKIELLNF